MNVQAKFRKDQWRMLLVTMLCYLFFYTGRHNFGWAAKDIAEELQLSYASVGWISSCMLLGYGSGQLINGNFADRFSPRIMITLGAILSVAANFAVSYAGDYITILILWTLNGYFQSMAWAPGSRLITNWWQKEERGKAFGFYTMAAGGSSAITFLLSIILIQQDIPWNYLFRLPVLFLLGAAIIFYLISRNKPSDKGYQDLYEQENSIDINWKDRYKMVFGNKNFIIATFSLGFESMARYGLIVWVPVHLLGENFKSLPNYIWIGLLMPIGMAIGALTFGNISDLFFHGKKTASIRIGMLLAALIILLMYVLPDRGFWLAGLLMFLAGFFVYGPQANFWPLSPELLGEKYVGTGIGVMNACAYLFAALGEPLFGKIIDVTGNTSSIFIAIAVICVLSAVTISFVIPSKQV